MLGYALPYESHTVMLSHESDTIMLSPNMSPCLSFSTQNPLLSLQQHVGKHEATFSLTAVPQVGILGLNNSLGNTKEVEHGADISSARECPNSR